MDWIQTTFNGIESGSPPGPRSLQDFSRNKGRSSSSQIRTSLLLVLSFFFKLGYNPELNRTSCIRGRLVPKEDWDSIASVVYGRYVVRDDGEISGRWIITTIYYVDEDETRTLYFRDIS